MSIAYTHSFALAGLRATPVRVEADLSGGLPQFNLLGLPAQAAREARDRVRVAIQNLGYGFPAGRVTVQLTSSEPLESPALADLAIAAALLVAMGRVPAETLGGHLLLGQLALSGALLPLDQERAWVHGAVQCARPVVLPPLRTAPPRKGWGAGWGSVESLSELIEFARGERALSPFRPAALPAGGPRADLPRPSAAFSARETFSPQAWDEIHGQAQAKRAAIVALAGGHHLLMLGSPGVGKSMIAHRMSALQPPLEETEAQALDAVEALQGRALDLADSADSAGPTESSDCRAAPFRAPHHSASAAALFGGGRPFRPGEISLAHGGVLFLDELAEFRRDALEALREPLETGRVQPARLQSRFTMPARTQLVAAMNPCPCGLFGAQRAQQPACRCSLRQVEAYRARLSAPLLDRFDLVILMQSAPVESPSHPSQPNGAGDRDGFLTGVDWSGVRAKQAIQEARATARGRQDGLNAQLSEAALRRMPIHPAALALFERLQSRSEWSRRAMVGVLRVARTLADLAGCEAIDSAGIAQALDMRRGLQLMEAAPSS